MSTATGLVQGAARRWPALAAALWIACGALYLSLPPSPDQFEMDYMGWRILEGAVPYRDFIDMNWPGAMWMHALSTALFGNQLWSWRALDYVALALSAWFMQDLVKRAAGKTAAALSLMLYPLFYASLWHWFAGQPDMTASQMLLIALWCHVRAHETQAWRWQIGTGVFLAAAMLNKPTAGVLGPLLMLQALGVGLSVRAAVLHAGVAAAAAVGGGAVALLAVLAQGATIREVVDAVYTYNVWTQYADAATVEELARSWFSAHGASWHYLSVLGLSGAVVLCWRRPRQVAASALPVLWLGGLVSFLVQHRGFHYHLSPCFVAIIGLAAASLGMWLDTALQRGSRSWTAALAAAAIALVFVGGVKKLQHNYGQLPAALLDGDYSVHLADFAEGDGLTTAQAVALAQQIERTVPRGDTVLVLGEASSMNFLSRRPQPTRFFYAPVLINARPPLPMAERWIDLFESDLQLAKPRLCLISTWARKQWLDGDTRGARVLRELLETHYRRIGFVRGGRGGPTPDAGIEIYERL